MVISTCSELVFWPGGFPFGWFIDCWSPVWIDKEITWKGCVNYVNDSISIGTSGDIAFWKDYLLICFSCWILQTSVMLCSFFFSSCRQVIILIIFVFAIVFDNAVAGSHRGFSCNQVGRDFAELFATSKVNNRLDIISPFWYTCL